VTADSAHPAGTDTGSCVTGAHWDIALNSGAQREWPAGIDPPLDLRGEELHGARARARARARRARIRTRDQIRGQPGTRSASGMFLAAGSR
jgi:hypothetical protein